MDDELLVNPEVHETPEVTAEKKVYSKNEGYSVSSTSMVANLGSHCEMYDVKVNIKAATSLAMEIQEVIMLKGTDLLAKVSASPFIASCPKLTWLSSDEEVAVVDDKLNGNGIREDGVAMVYAVGVGEATITATAENGLTCSMDVNVVAEAGLEPEPIEAGSKYAFTSYSDDTDAPVIYSRGTVGVLSTTKKLAKLVVLTNEPDEPVNPLVGREFYVDRSIEVGDGNKYPLYTNTSKTVVPGVMVEVTKKVEEEA